MRIDIKVFPQARKNCYKEEQGKIKVYLSAPALEGRANEALVDFLSEHFGVRKSCISIVKGLKSRLKTINIEGI